MKKTSLILYLLFSLNAFAQTSNSVVGNVSGLPEKINGKNLVKLRTPKEDIVLGFDKLDPTVQSLFTVDNKIKKQNISFSKHALIEKTRVPKTKFQET